MDKLGSVRQLEIGMQEAFDTGRPLIRGRLESFPDRDWFAKRYGFAVPDIKAVEAIIAHGPVLEVGAGTGYWSRILSRHDVAVVSTDIASGVTGFGQQIGAWHPVTTQPADEAIRDHPGWTVLMVWPSYDDPWAFEAAKVMKSGAVLAYVGEGHGGCTATDSFHDYLDRRFDELAAVYIPTFLGMHDSLHVYRKSGDQE